MYTKSESIYAELHEGQASKSQNSPSGIKNSTILVFYKSIDCTKRQQYTLVFLVAMINLFKQCSHSIHQPGISPPYFEFKLVCTIELSGEKEAIWKSNSPGFKFQE